MIYNFDRNFYEKTGEFLAKIFAKTKATPNQITFIRFFTLIPISVYLFSLNQHLTNILAVFLLYLDVVLDYVDGRLARMKNLKSEIGAWLDEFEDKITQVVILMGIIWGVYMTSGKDSRWLFVGLTLILATNIQSFIGAYFKEKYNLYYETLPNFWEFFKNKKISKWESFLKDWLAPKNFFYTLVATYSYFIVLGAVFNIMRWMVLAMTILGLLHGLIMCYIFARTIIEKKRVSLLVEGIRKLKGLT
jgi:phosphatidylglycerophosphate synthase